MELQVANIINILGDTTIFIISQTKSNMPQNYKHQIRILSPKKEYIGIGVMSGSSLDGLDIAAVKFIMENHALSSFEIISSETFPYEEQWIARLEHLPHASALDFAKTHIQYGHYLGKKILKFCKQYAIKPDFVASHGHTIFHQPEKFLTFQIGCGQTICSYLRCPLVNDFRTKDVANGGQGAPLVPLVEKELFPQISIFINLGGFVNIAIHQSDNLIGYDITACNRVLNYYTWKFTKNPYDKNGNLASQGNIITDLLQYLQAIPYFSQKPPKSLGNEWLEAFIFPTLDEYALKYDYPSVLRTWCEHVALEISKALPQNVNETILITGGGAKNLFLMQCIQEKLSPNLSFMKINEQIIDFKESIIFAFLGLKTLLGIQHYSLNMVTGGKNTILGSIHLG